MKANLFAALGLLAASHLAWAEDAAPAAPANPAQHNARGHGACRPDVAKFCADVKPGRGAILACLESHKDEISPGCKTMLEKAQARRAGAGTGNTSGTKEDGKNGEK